jgi:mycothione reductase
MRHYDLIVVGGGSGNTLFGPEHETWDCALVEEDRLGGTCMNRGCIPSKMYVVAADHARHIRDAARLNLRATYEGVDWPALRDRVFSRIDPAHESGVRYRRENGIEVYDARARFVAPKVLEVRGERITAKQIVVAVGTRPMVPEIPGLADVGYHTSDSIMRLDALPRSMVVLGGGFIAAEMSHVFSALGADVTVLQRGPRLLMAEDHDVSAAFTRLASQRMRVETGVHLLEVRPHADGALVRFERDGAPQEVVAETILVATGRIPNTDRLDAEAGGLALDDQDRLVVDEHFRTTVDGVWAFGDVANDFQLKHMANAEARVVRHNLSHPDDLHTLGHVFAPHAVFADPQIAAYGLTGHQAAATGRPVKAVRRFFGDTAYGWAMEDSTSFVKVIADTETRAILGAHVMGPHAALVIQPLVQAMTFGQTVDQLAHDIIYIHPALSEVIEQVMLEL